MQPALIEPYKQILAGVFVLSGDEDIEDLIEEIEGLDDDTREVRQAFIENRSDIKAPVYWIAILRVMKLGYNFRSDLLKQYDSFVSVYQKLSGKNEMTDDERHLFTEIGNFLYRVDELLGDHERFSHRMLHGIRQGIIEDYGVNLDIDDNFFRTKMSTEIIKKYNPLTLELIGMLDRFLEQIRIMNALSRLNEIIIKGK